MASVPLAASISGTEDVEVEPPLEVVPPYQPFQNQSNTGHLRFVSYPKCYRTYARFSTHFKPPPLVIR